MSIIEQVASEVKKCCYSPDNIFGPGIWTHHIVSVVENAVFLAKKFGADIEVVTLAAYLHDIASITDKNFVKEHHSIGADMSSQFLKGLNYPQEKIEMVYQCILNHRGSRLKEKQTLEEVCVADADAIAHFDNLPSLFFLVFKEMGLGIDEGTDFIKKKLERSFEKLSAESKAIFQQRYSETMSLID
jgi:uncharacterized protein